MRKFLGVLMVLSLSLGLLAGCGQQKPAAPAPAAPAPAAPAAQPAPAPAPAPAPKKEVPGVTDTEIVLGTWMPVTGPAAAWSAVGRAHEAYWKYVNETQGGINGRKVRYIIEDDSYSPAKTVPMVKKMVEQDKVFAFLGGLGTAGGMAVMDYVIQNGVPHVAPSTGSSKWSDPVKPLYFGYMLNYQTEARILVKYGVETLKKTKFAIFYQNDDYGKEGLDEAKVQLAKRGAQVVAEVAYNPTDTDYSAYAAKLKQSGAEVVLGWPSVRQYASLLKEAGKIGFKPIWLNSTTVQDPSLIQLAGPDAEGVHFVTYLPDPLDPANADLPAIKEWRENLQKYNKDLPLGFFTLFGWTQARLMHEGLKRAGKDLTREGLIKALESLKDFDLGLVTYSPTDRRGISQGWMTQVKGDRIVKISDIIKAD